MGIRTTIQRFIQEGIVIRIVEVGIERIGGISLTQSRAIEGNALFTINECDTIDTPTFISSDNHTQALFLESLSEFFFCIGRSTHNFQYLPSNGWYQWLDDLLRFLDRKSTRLNSSHANISYAVFC